MKMRRRNKKHTSFQPDKKTVQVAVDEYLKDGGKITKIEYTSKSYKQFVAQKEMGSLVDEYLRGESYF